MEFTTIFTKEVLEQARKAESAEALQALAKKNGHDMGAEEAEAYFAQLHKSGELSDEELENVSGGGCRKDGHLVVTTSYSCDLWFCRKDRKKIWDPRKEPDYSPMTDWPPSKCKCPMCGTTELTCNKCYYCHYEKGLWLCYNPQK